MTKAERKALAQKYRNAALSIEIYSEKFVCFALGMVGVPCKTFEDWFKADAIEYGLAYDDLAATFAWMGNVITDGSDSTEIDRDCRVIALCLMAAMIETGDA